LLFCAKNIERIGDHATHIAEAAYLIATGHRPEAERQRLDTSSTLTGGDLA
jgi:phosphate transport system protein